MRCERHGTSVTDVGAQYITPTGDNSDLCDELRRAGLLVPLSGRIDGTRAADGGGENFVSPDGLQAIVAHLLENTTVECGRAAAPPGNLALAVGNLKFPEFARGRTAQDGDWGSHV